ncbi:unnamed protein product [Schistosoma margrebowiei]|uniref:Uncharacterized protein n=1 Tax=Schistosoma margrebowiei TaxID=48269 RepID=A0A183M6N1_9TREM|nr:unnamed protein product [Schistosoma margrebowiei]
MGEDLQIHVHSTNWLQIAQYSHTNAYTKQHGSLMITPLRIRSTISASVGLSIHKRKTKVLKFNTENSNLITLDGETLEDVEFFIYPGSIIDEQGGSDADVKAGIGKARTAFLQLNNIWNSKQPIS